MKFLAMIVAVLIVQGEDGKPVVDHVTQMGDLVQPKECKDIVQQKYGPSYPHASAEAGDVVNGHKVISVTFHCVPLTEKQAQNALDLMGTE